MGEKWIKEAEDLKSNGQSGTMTRNHGGVKVTWHVTVSPSGGSMFSAMHGVLTRKKSEPHILYDPLTDRLGQYFPLDRSARALGNDGNRPTNRDGTINIQIEVVAQPDGFTRYWKPGPNYAALMRAIRSWGIPDTWPGGRLAPSGRADQQVSRSWGNYVKSGHFGHSQVPGNDHWDPGPIDQQAIFTATKSSSTGGAQSVKPSTAKPKFKPLWKPTGKMTVRQIQKAVGVTADGLYGESTKAAVKKYQGKLGVAADGLWGESTEAAHNSGGSKSKGALLAVDGIEGAATVKALQRHVGAKVDGIRGRSTNKAMQKWLGVAQDGKVGPATIRALQKKIGTPVDGIWGRNTTRALQRYLNEH